MNSGRHRPIGSGKPAIGGSIGSIVIIVLVIVVIVLGAVAFSMYSTTKSQAAALDSKQADLEAVSTNLSQMTSDYATLNADYNRNADELLAVRGNYDNVSAQYTALLNRSSLVDGRLNTFLENEPTIAYTYTVSPKQLPDGSHDTVLLVTAYNLGKADVANVKVICTVNESNSVNAYNKTFSSVRSLDKRQAEWEFQGNATVVSVWAGIE